MAEEELELEEEEEEGLRERIVLLVRVVITTALLVVGFFWLNEANFGLWVNLALMAVAWLIIAYDIAWKAIKNLFKKGNPFDEHVLMTVSTIGAFCLRFFGPEHNEFLEGVLVMLLYQIGEFFQDLAADRSRHAITAAIDLRDQKATILKEDGSQIIKSPEEIEIGDVFLWKVGEKALADGKVVEGNGEVDESSLTGEFVPISKAIGIGVSSGTLLTAGSLKVKVLKEYKDSTVKKLLDLVQNNVSKKSKADRFITKFAKIYTPIVMGLALLVGIIPPLFLGVSDSQVWSRWIYTALTFLVISCPCAIVIGIPLTYFAGLGLASKHGILIKGGEYLDKLNDLEAVAFDKTGTLTEGRFEIVSIHPFGMSEEQFMEYLVAAESRSNHPLARAIIGERDLAEIHAKIESYEEIAGFGVRLTYAGHRLLAGNKNILNDSFKANHQLPEIGTVVYLVADEECVGYLLLNDVAKANAKPLVKALRAKGIGTILLSGDRAPNVQALAKELSLDEFHGELTPEEKAKILQAKIASAKGTIAFLGDGINDAPSIVLSDVGIAMGGLGSDMAVQNADIVLMNDDPYQLFQAWRVARKTQMRAWIILAISLIVKMTCMILAIVLPGFPLWSAVLADSGLALAMVLVALSLLWTRMNKGK